MFQRKKGKKWVVVVERNSPHTPQSSAATAPARECAAGQSKPRRIVGLSLLTRQATHTTKTTQQQHSSNTATSQQHHTKVVSQRMRADEVNRAG
jgi:hypothetical protein